LLAWAKRRQRELSRAKRNKRNKRIRELRGQGDPKKGIARELKLCPKTVRRVLSKGTKPKKRGPSKLDDYRAVIRYKALEEDWQVRQIFKYLRGLGYKGGETILRQYVRQIRPKPARRPALRFETERGVQGQVDLSPYDVELGGALTAVVCFSFVLCWSRWRFFWFVEQMDRFMVMWCHRMAFEELGGVPAHILYDQMKQVVIAVLDSETVLQDDFARFVLHYGFSARVLEAGYKEGKGKVERPFQDVETFLRHHRFHSLDDLNEKACRWRHDELHVTPHRTTGESPAERVVAERPHLLQLADKPFRCEQRQRAHTGKHFHVEYLGRFYSVPPEYADRWVTRCVLGGRLWVELGDDDEGDDGADDDVISEHELRTDGPKFVTLPEHQDAFRKMGTRKKTARKAFVAMGPAAERFAEGLDRTQAGASTYHMTQILKLVRRIGTRRVLDALRYATGYEAFNHTAVARIARVRRHKATSSAVQDALGAAGHNRPQLPSTTAETDPADASSPQRPLDHYDALIRDKSRATKEQDDGK
jgi:transposase